MTLTYQIYIHHRFPDISNISHIIFKINDLTLFTLNGVKKHFSNFNSKLFSKFNYFSVTNFLTSRKIVVTLVQRYRFPPAYPESKNQIKIR